MSSSNGFIRMFYHPFPFYPGQFKCDIHSQENTVSKDDHRHCSLAERIFCRCVYRKPLKVCLLLNWSCGREQQQVRFSNVSAVEIGGLTLYYIFLFNEIRHNCLDVKHYGTFSSEGKHMIND